MTSAAIAPLTVVSEPDPLDAYGDLITVDQNLWTTRTEMFRPQVYHHNRIEWCAAEQPGGGYRVCSRSKHPTHWRHVATNNNDILAIWGPDAPPPSGEPIDPEDGSAPDPPEVVLTSADLNLGFCYKLRDRKNILYVIGGAGEDLRSDGQVEVLDLEKREYRILPATHIVAWEYTLSLDELSWVGSYVHKMRNAVREEAVEQYLADRWCREGLNSSLSSLGLPKYDPILRGTISVSIPFTAGDLAAGKSQVEKLLKPILTKALEGLEVPDSDLGVVLRKTAATVSVSNLARK